MIQALWSLDQQFQNKNGSILTHGKIYVYYSGRTALATTYSDEDGTVVNTNPIILDNNGRAACFASSMYAYTVVVCDAYGKELFSYDITLHDAVETAEKVFVIGTDGTVQVDTTTLPNGVQYDLSVNTDIIATNELVENVSANIQDQLDNKKDLQEEKSYNGSQTKTITNISQDENGVITVTYEDIDLPPEVPNVEITSPNGTIDVQSTTDVQTNTKTFTIDVKQGDVNWINARSAGTDMRINENITITGYMKKDGNLDTVPQYNLLPLKNEVPYLVIEELSLKTVAPEVNKCSDVQVHLFNEGISGVHAGDIVAYVRLDNSNEYTQTITVGGILYGGMTGRSSDTYSGGIYASAMNKFTGSVIEGNIVATVNNISVYELSSIMSQGSGTTYTAGDAIDLTNDEISVKYGNGLTVNGSNELEVKVGEGLSIDPVSGVVMIDTEVGDVVETVEKLKRDLDTQLTVNFDMPNVDNVYDFADPTVIGNLSNGAVMLCQAFTVPINHDIRVDDGETENPTLIGIYAKQAFTGKKIMLALYVYDFETGYTDYVGDTGPVEVTQGRNEFPLVHNNPNITELKSSCVYYASLYLPSNAHSNGLFLAGCPSYSNASYINATPRFTVGVQNIVNPNTNQEIDMSNATTGRLDFNDGNGNYYIGPWSDNYNERPSIPRFFMQIRNGEVEEPIIVEPFTDIGTYTLKNTDSISSVFGSSVNVNTSTYGAVFMEVTPAQDVDVTGWICYDNYATDERQWYGNVFDSNFENQLSQASDGSIQELGEISTGVYGHEFIRSTALHLTAGTTYRFLVGIPHTDNDLLVQYNTPTNQKTLHLFASGYNVSQWITYSRANNVQGINFVIKDANHEWRI